MESHFKAALAGRRRVVFAGLAFLMTGLFAGRQLATWPGRLRYPGEECYIEGVSLAEMVRIQQGLPIYASPTPERFDAALYGPLYYLLGSRLIDINQPSYFSARLLSLAALIGCAIGCGLLAFWLSNSYLAAALAPLLVLSYDFVNWFGLSMRSDLIGLFFFFAGFLVAYRFRNSRAILAAVPLMLLGAFFKQQFVAGPLAVLLFLLFEKRYRLAVQFAGLLVLPGLGLLALFQFVVFRDQSFLAHFLLFNSHLFAPSLETYADCLLFFGIVLVLPALLAAVFLRGSPDRLLACYLGCAVLFGLAVTIRTGSDVNYFLECALIPSPMLASLTSRKIGGPRAGAWLIALGATLVVAQYRTYLVPTPADYASDQAEQEYLRRNFPAHTQALGYFTGDLLRAGLDTPISYLYVYSRLVRDGMISDRNLLSQLSNHRFGVIALSFDLENETDPWRREHYLTGPMRRAILENYRPAASLDMPNPEKVDATDRLYFWVPRRHSGKP